MDQHTMDMLAGFAHELRTPLGAISGYAELLRLGAHGPVPDAQADVLGRILQNQRRMVTLLDEMAAYSAMLADTRPAERDDADLLALVHEAVTRATSLAEPRAVSLHVAHDVADRITVRTDATLVAAALDAMLVDAMRHAADGDRITLAVRSSDIAVRVAVTVPTDAVTAAQATMLFIPFRSGAHATDPHPLALPRARAMAQRLGGDLCADPEALHRTLVLDVPRSAAAR